MFFILFFYYYVGTVPPMSIRLSSGFRLIFFTTEPYIERRFYPILGTSRSRTFILTKYHRCGAGGVTGMTEQPF